MFFVNCKKMSQILKRQKIVVYKTTTRNGWKDVYFEEKHNQQIICRCWLRKNWSEKERWREKDWKFLNIEEQYGCLIKKNDFSRFACIRLGCFFLRFQKVFFFFLWILFLFFYNVIFVFAAQKIYLLFFLFCW